jgi:hypothetical protein
MKHSKGFVRRSRTTPAQRAQLLARFERCGLSAAAFARQHKLHYTTFCGWRQRQAKAEPSPGFVQVELPTPKAPAELVIELSASARMRITDAGQIALAVRLLRELPSPEPC